MPKKYEKHYFYAAEVSTMETPNTFVSGEYVCYNQELSLEGRMEEIKEALRVEHIVKEHIVYAVDLITFNNIYL